MINGLAEFDMMVNDLRNRIIPVDFDSLVQKISQLKLKCQIIRVMRELGWTKGKGWKALKSLDDWFQACLNELTNRIPLIGCDELFENDREVQEFWLTPDFLGMNGFSYDDFCEMANEPEMMENNFSLMAYLMLIGFGSEENAPALINRFGWPAWELIHVPTKGMRESYLRRHLDAEMMAAMEISVLTPNNDFLSPTPEEPAEIEFSAENVRYLLSDLKEAQRLNELAGRAMEKVMRDPTLLIGLAETLRKSQKQ